MDDSRHAPVSAQTFGINEAGGWSRVEPILKMLIVGVTVVFGYLGLARLDWPSLPDWPTAWSLSNIGRLLIISYGVVVFASLIWRIMLWRRYRPAEPVADAELPPVSLIMPAFNEGELVRHGILAAAKSDYPRDRFEIIVIDDGSTDDTWRHIRAAADEIGETVRLTTIRLPENAGKRRALELGFQRATGDIWVTTDSDSLFEKSALRNIVAPLVRDAGVTCVAGCVNALNAGRNIITRFMKCYFSLSFKFVRAYQHQIDAVFCAPGALSAYRADSVRSVLREWSDQQFLGQPCATGEDRAMTNLLLREGGRTAYQQTAVVWSRVPESYAGMAKMFLRWSRSNIRETIVLWKFLFTRFRSGTVAAFRLNMILVLMSLVLSPILISHTLGLALVSDGFVLRYVSAMALFSGVMAAVYYRNERDSDWIWLFVYQIFAVAGLSWIMPYAALTLRNTGWLTRGGGQSTDSDDRFMLDSHGPGLAVR